jgi:hypothetical protein
LFVLAIAARVMIAYFRGEVTACQARMKSKQELPARNKLLHIQELSSLPSPIFSHSSNTTLLNYHHQPPA